VERERMVRTQEEVVGACFRVVSCHSRVWAMENLITLAQLILGGGDIFTALSVAGPCSVK
jgi:hypothetical protein